MKKTIIFLIGTIICANIFAQNIKTLKESYVSRSAPPAGWEEPVWYSNFFDITSLHTMWGGVYVVDNGDTLPPTYGDCIGKFEIEEGELICRGYQWVVDTSNTGIIGIGADTAQPINIAGFEENDSVIYQIYKGDKDETYPCTFAEYQQEGIYPPEFWANDGLFHNQKISIVTEMFFDCNDYFSQTVYLQEGWNSISSYLIDDRNIAEILPETFNNPTDIIQDQTKIYWPYQNINTLNVPEYKNGYKIHCEQDMEVTYIGTWPTDRTIDFQAGWNFISVLDSVPVYTYNLFGEPEWFLVVQNIVGAGIYWPSEGINTLPYLTPGHGYKVYTEQAFTIDFGDVPSVLETGIQDFKEVKEVKDYPFDIDGTGRIVPEGKGYKLQGGRLVKIIR